MPVLPFSVTHRLSNRGYRTPNFLKISSGSFTMAEKWSGLLLHC